MLKIISALADNGVIGRDGDLPWKLRDDLRWFKESTMNLPVVMGSKTFDSIVKRLHKPLPDRENIVLTRSPSSRKCGDVVFLDDFSKVVEWAKRRSIFAIGGASIYQLALPIADQLFLTRVHAEVDGDVRFPEWDPKEWTLDYSLYHEQDERNDFPFTWEIYTRRQHA